MTMTQTNGASVPPGLKGVAVTDTTIGDVRGQEGFYHYRQYSATELAERRSLEDVWRLLVDGELPRTPAETESFATEVRSQRDLLESIRALLPSLVHVSGKGGPLDGLRTAISLLGAAEGFHPLWDLPPSQRRANLIRLAAATPTIVAALYRLANGQEPVAPDAELGHAANYLRMVTGVPAHPDVARALEQYLILTVDHGFNSSTFTARVITSTGADAAAAVTGAIGALSGPLHGGAPSRALDLLDAIGTADRAESYVRDLLLRGERVMGFGHAVYRTDDPRSLMLRSVAERLGGDLVDLAVSVEATITRLLAEMKADRPLYANVEYYAGVVMDACGLPRDMFTPTFAVSRVIGWCANVLEQASDPKIIRPAARYVGVEPPVAVPSPPAAY